MMNAADITFIHDKIFPFENEIRIESFFLLFERLGNFEIQSTSKEANSRRTGSSFPFFAYVIIKLS